MMVLSSFLWAVERRSMLYTRYHVRPGLNNLGDVQKLIELMPRPLALYLRCACSQKLHC